MSGKFALIIGNTEYRDPGLAQLTAPGKDAEDFARVLKDNNLCGFDEVTILLNQLSSSVIESVDEFFDQKKPDDMLVLYFSGHGVRDEMGLLYLAVKNTIRSRLRSTAIRSDYIREAMDQSRSKRQILILDCCNSGAFPQGTKAEIGGTMGMTKAFQGYGRFVLTASDATQFAWEGDKVIGQTDNSLFTHFLVKGLEGEADSDGDGKITVDELYDYAYDQISRVTPKQTPTKSASKQEGEIVLRQITRLEHIKPISLPDELIEATEDSRTFVREGAVQQLEKLLKGRNLGLARSAREVLERIEKEDDSRRVSQAAGHVLEPIRQAEKEEEERKAKEEAERIAAQKVEEERLALEKAETERKSKQEAERLLTEQKAEEEKRAKKEAEERKARQEAERLAVLKAEEERIAREKAEAKAKAQEDAQRLAAQQAEAERIAREKAESERKAKKEAERLLAEQNAEKERKAKEEAERLAAIKAEEEAESLTRAKVSKLKGEREEFVYVTVDQGVPLYHSLPATNNWTVWLENGAKLTLTKPDEAKTSIGKYGQYIAVLDEEGNEGFVRASSISTEREVPEKAANRQKPEADQRVAISRQNKPTSLQEDMKSSKPTSLPEEIKLRGKPRDLPK